ncbi:MAG: tRNA (pseudouridine(54)-N(1))-methyltransferase TrmY [Candidatus Thermoplasmatota archaeon]|nr:tRNA (pseudouridine(54)-N(1))-methyltransferase TrmY [Euryarchaeota archaeon]MBU4032462.1 tRNA (pseudouridine(54)-N(1))-methyltransferase TrmY [Candidatus Thermoplasmatota archaeon]MBU4071413.1 tRNA (pseudouridine(54)-N(1))-methyltransferase TrmY [Candidatus Thermoplasmatota archaeon]MBU4144458.1 tRNA (pseudouridine(54)-N(1))-methyltransferase TrmY [Candidatus Thermoplasmatota archaeon]MBU4592310.1 tRNA (pseudouridine(54)-N(1))-methyltransferase TrmY [Candidatus Thermoplasmatota archaeon]
MTTFVVIGHKVTTEGKFSLNDLSGSTGRLDVLLRCVNSAFMLSNSIRRDVELYLVLLGEPRPPVMIHLKGQELKYLNPDERSTGALVKNALMKTANDVWQKSTPGIYVARKNLADVLAEFTGRRIVYLKEEGSSVSDAALTGNDIFILGGKDDLTSEEEEIIQNWPNTLKISLGPISLHADHCITVALNRLDNSS